jgi:hypothetical protein
MHMIHEAIITFLLVYNQHIYLAVLKEEIHGSACLWQSFLRTIFHTRWLLFAVSMNWAMGMTRIWGEVGRGPVNKQAGAALPVCLEREIEQCARLQLFAIHACTCWWTMSKSRRLPARQLEKRCCTFGHGSSQDMLYAACIYTHAALQCRCIHVISEWSPGSDHCASLGGRRWENPRWCRCRSWWGY